MGIKIWQRYFLMEMTKVFLLFIFGFYFLYILIDYTSRTGSLLGNQMPFWELSLYYLLTFLKRIDLLLPFGLLISVIKALCSLNVHNELVALLASGISLKRLLRPFLAIGLACSALVFFNHEFLVPYAWGKIQRIEDRYSGEGERSAERNIQDIPIDDGSRVLCQAWDSAREYFFDCYWIRSIDELYRIKYLYPDAVMTVGRFVDHLKRNDDGEMVLVESFTTKALDLGFSDEALMSAMRSPEELSLRQLWERLPHHGRVLSDKESHITARFFSRLATPWMCLLAVLAPAPFCVRFTRQPRILLIYIFSILGLVTFYLLMDAAIILGQSQVLPPAVAIFVPYAIYLAIFGRRYAAL